MEFTSTRQISCANAKEDDLKCFTLFFRKACSKKEKLRLIKERNEKIAEYNDKLDDMKDEAVTKYCRCIIRNLKKIKECHEELVKKYVALIVAHLSSYRVWASDEFEKLSFFPDFANVFTHDMKRLKNTKNHLMKRLPILSNASMNITSRFWSRIKIHIERFWPTSMVVSCYCSFSRYLPSYEESIQNPVRIFGTLVRDVSNICTKCSFSNEFELKKQYIISLKKSTLCRH